MKVKALIIIFLAVAAFAAGIYFKDSAIDLYNNLRLQVENFQKIDFGKIISEAQKKVLTPDPLWAGGPANQVVLTKSKIILETNIQRQNNGLAPLVENSKLDVAAEAKAKDMFKNQYFEHESPSGIDPGKLVSSYGYEFIVAGENLILGNFSSEKQVVETWMASLGHRENILNSRYSEIGVAIIKGEYKGSSVWIGVQEFGLPLSACPEIDADLKAEIDFKKAQLDELSFTIDERKEQIESLNPRSAAYRQMIDDYNQLVTQYNLLAQELKLIILTYNSQVNIFNNCVVGK